jgi:hypothetical protein
MGGSLQDWLLAIRRYDGTEEGDGRGLISDFKSGIQFVLSAQ